MQKGQNGSNYVPSPKIGANRRSYLTSNMTSEAVFVDADIIFTYPKAFFKVILKINTYIQREQDHQLHFWPFISVIVRAMHIFKIPDFRQYSQVGRLRSSLNNLYNTHLSISDLTFYFFILHGISFKNICAYKPGIAVLFLKIRGKHHMPPNTFF